MKDTKIINAYPANYSMFLRQYGVSTIVGVIIGIVCTHLIQSTYFLNMLGVNDLPVPMEPFPEAPWRTPNTLNVKTVTSTPFARFEIHQVKTDSGIIVDDWLWTDERAHVNILVHMKETNKYMLFKQKKYGLDREKYAAVGGLFNRGDTPEGCARRELLEETGLVTDELINLGAYRVQVNRGGGILHAFLARNCVKKTNKSSKSNVYNNSTSLRGGPLAHHIVEPEDSEVDYEFQDAKYLTKKELLHIILHDQEIGEAQWLSAISTGLLHEDYFDRV